MNPFLGLIYHWIGGASAASFYVPYRGVRHWAWEVFWLTGGFFSWIVAPWIFAAALTSDLPGVLGAAPGATLFWCYLFGAAWGIGGLTFGLTLKYLGMSIGMAMALGMTTVFGTLVPPLYEGELVHLARTQSGQAVLVGLLIVIAGIVVVGLAGHRRERETGAKAQASEAMAPDFRKGVAVAMFSGVMSASFAYGLAAGEAIRGLSVAAGSNPLFQGLPVLCVVLLGGFTTNALWCGYLIVKRRSWAQWAGAKAAEGAKGADRLTTGEMLRNYGLCALGGVTWYLQFFFYTMGESQMGGYAFSSWTLHMASIILFSTVWGFVLKEWKGASGRAILVVLAGLLLLVIATVVIGWGNALAAH